MNSPELKWEESETDSNESNPIQALRFLALLLLKASAAPDPATSADTQIPLDVAGQPEVGSDRD